MARSRTGQILPEGSRVYVEEQLFRAASAFAFDWGLQPRPALKGIHPRRRGHEWPLFHAYASACAPGAKKHPTGRNPGVAQVRGTPPSCLNVEERLGGRAAL